MLKNIGSNLLEHMILSGYVVQTKNYCMEAFHCEEKLIAIMIKF